MSIKVMNWVWDQSPTRGTELLMLLAIADNADDAGRNAFPSVRTLARKTRLDERTVQRIVRKLAEQGQLLVDNRGGRNPNRYAIPMPTESSTPPANRNPRQNAAGGTAAAPPPAQRRPRGGTAVPPEPPGTIQEPSSPAEDEAAEEDGRTEDIDAVLDGLGSAWPLTPKQRRKLAPKVVEALAAGWSRQRLVRHLGANPEGVQSPAAVLSSRLNDLPPAEHRPAPRPEWCGECDEPSRTVPGTDGRWRRCRCHPQSNDRNPGRVKPPSTSRPEPSTPTSHETGRSDTSVSHRD